MEPVSRSCVLTVPGNWGNGNGEWRMGKGESGGEMEPFVEVSGRRGGDTVQSIRRQTTTPTCLPFLFLPGGKGTKEEGEKKRHELQRHDACKPDNASMDAPIDRFIRATENTTAKRHPKATCSRPAVEHTSLEMNLILFHSCSGSPVRLHMLLLMRAKKQKNCRDQPTRRQ